MRLARQLLLTLNFTILIATVASSQGISTPQGLATAVTAPSASEPWSMTVGLNETYEDNVQLTAEGTGSLGSAIHGGLARTWALDRGRGDIRASGDATQIFYRETPNLNQLTYGANVGVAYALTRRLQWTLGDSLTQGYAQDAKVLTDQGVVLPKVVTRTNSASTQFAYALSPASQMQWGVSSQRASFETSALTDSSQFFTRLSYSHQIGRAQRIGIAQDFQRSITGDTTETNFATQGTWQRPIGKDSGVILAGGIQPYTLSGVDGFHFAPTTNVSVNTHVRQRDTVALSYARTIEQALGLGHTYESHIVSGSYGLTPSPNLGVDFGVNYARNRDPVAPEAGFSGTTASVSMKYALRPRLSLTGGYNLFSRTVEPGPLVLSSRWLVGLTYGKTWR
jgi:hypothetical protein